MGTTEVQRLAVSEVLLKLLFVGEMQELMGPELKCRPHHEGHSRNSNTNPLQAIYPVSHRPLYRRRGEGPYPLRRGKEPAYGRTHAASKLDGVGQPRRGSHEHKRVMSSRIWYGE